TFSLLMSSVGSPFRVADTTIQVPSSLALVTSSFGPGAASSPAARATVSFIDMVIPSGAAGNRSLLLALQFDQDAVRPFLGAELSRPRGVGLAEADLQRVALQHVDALHGLLPF